jgi:hypothetical protein
MLVVLKAEISQVKRQKATLCLIDKVKWGVLSTKSKSRKNLSVD